MSTWHTHKVEGFEGSLEELAKAVGNMTYDKVSAFVEELGKDLYRQAQADQARGRVKLAARLRAASREFSEAKEELDEAWEICEPYIKGA